MSAIKNRPNRRRLKLVGGKDFVQEDLDEDFTVAPAQKPTFKKSLGKLRRRVSEKLFSIELTKISF